MQQQRTAPAPHTREVKFHVIFYFTQIITITFQVLDNKILSSYGWLKVLKGTLFSCFRHISTQSQLPIQAEKVTNLKTF